MEESSFPQNMEKIMSDYFTIGIDVEEGHVGKVLRNLDTMQGVVTIHLRMAKNQPTQVPQLKQEATGTLPAVIRHKISRRPPSVVGKSTVRSVIAQSLHKGAMHSKLLAQILERSGLSGASVASALTKMSENKSIKRVGPGTYALTKAGERKYIRASDPNKVHGNTHNNGLYGHNNRKGLRALVLNSLLQKSYEHFELKELLVDNDYSANNMYVLVSKLIEEGLIQRNDDTYTITDQGREAFSSVQPEVLPPDPNQHGEIA